MKKWVFNNQKFSVPLIIRTKPKINLLRPNPKYGQMMIISSNLNHGGGINDNFPPPLELEIDFFFSKREIFIN